MFPLNISANNTERNGLNFENSPEIMSHLISQSEKTDGNNVTITSHYMIGNNEYYDMEVRDINTKELLYTKIIQGNDETTYTKGDNFVITNGEKIYFSVEKEISFESNLEESISSYTNSSIYWMPIRTTWYTFSFDTYIKDTANTTLEAAAKALLWYTTGFGGIGAVISTVKAYHVNYYALRYNKSWKCKETYCGAQGYYNKYAMKNWHYAITGSGGTDYIENSYRLIEIY
jgi:hypothetical protein